MEKLVEEPMLRFVPKCKPVYQHEYWAKCNRSNLKYVWYFSLFTLIISVLHLAYDLRSGFQTATAQMMPYIMFYAFCVLYAGLNMIVIWRLRSSSSLHLIANIIEAIFPFIMAAISVILSVISANAGLGITPFVVITLLLSFVLQGKFSAIATMLLMTFAALTAALYPSLPTDLYYPLIAIAFVVVIACLFVAYSAETTRINEFQTLTELNSTNRQLKLLSQQDHLTGLLNRRAIDRILLRELSRSERFDHSLSLLIIDIDDFKIVNDNFGHVVGDRVIQEIAQKITLQIRDVDYVGRLGGDEFVVILIETGKEAAMEIAQRILRAISQTKVTEHEIEVTISLGHALSEGESHVALIEKADKALYQAKRGGKNRVKSIQS